MGVEKRYEILCSLASNLLGCGYLDMDSLVSEVNRLGYHANHADFRGSIEDWGCLPSLYDSQGGINLAFHSVLDAQAQAFIEENSIPEENAEYEIFTNCMDSSVYFKHAETDARFQDWAFANEKEPQ